MTTADAIAAALRVLAPNAKLNAEDVLLIDELAAAWDARVGTMEPPWVAVARTKLGESEIVGKQHNQWIAQGWARLGATWYNDDETPWCGFFVADCLAAAGLPYPKNFPAAASFKTYGVACTARLGAIAVKTRKGGNHVFFIVGETPDGRFYKALGGNQGDKVSIVDVPKTTVTAIRWPAGLPLRDGLPVLPHGTTAGSEA